MLKQLRRIESSYQVLAVGMIACVVAAASAVTVQELFDHIRHH